jgi:CheY-like chemotaxis protein
VRLTPSILVVEDHDGARKMLQELLAAEGFFVRTAAHGGEALRQLRQHKPDLIVLDLLLPWISGMEVLATIRGDADFAEVPVVVTTGTSTMQQDLHAYEPVVVMRKPLDHDSLVATVYTMLEDTRAAGPA